MNDDIALRGDQKRNVAAAGGVIGAVLASACCIGPLVLITLGVGGAWTGNLTALKVYQPVFVIVALSFIGFGFWQVYGQEKPDCADGSYCATPASDLIIKSVLWLATFLVALAVTTDLWAPFFY